MRAEARWAVEDGHHRCEAITLKKTRCLRLSPLRFVDVYDKIDGEWKWAKQWRCRQHGG